MKKIFEIIEGLVIKNDRMTKEWYDNGYLVLAIVLVIIILIMVII